MSLYDEYKNEAGSTKSLYGQYKKERFFASPVGKELKQQEDIAKQRAEKLSSPLGIAKETIRNEGKLLGGLAKGVWGIAKSIPGSLLSAAKHPYETAVGVAEEAALKPTAYITKEVGNLTGLQKIKQLAEREKQGLGGIEQYIYNTPEKKRAANVGEFLGWMLPYSAAEKAIGMIPKIEKLGKLTPIVKDLGAWISTDQLLYNPDTDGSRAKQVLEDLAAFGVLKGAGKLYRAIKGKVAVDLADRFVKPVEEAMKKGEKVPIETAEEAVNKAKRIVKAETGKEPKQLVKEEVIPKVAPKIAKIEKPVETKIPKARKYKSAEEFWRRGILPFEQNERFKAINNLKKEASGFIGNRKLQITPDGYIKFYHGTTKDWADKVLKEGKIDVYMAGSHSKNSTLQGDEGALWYAKKSKNGKILELKVDPRDVSINGAGELEIENMKRVGDHWQSIKRPSFDTRKEIKDFYNQAIKQPIEKGVKKGVEIKPKQVRVARSFMPVGEGKEMVSRLEKRITDRLKSIPKYARENLATYNQMNKKEQIRKASEYVAKNKNEALDVLLGKKPTPKGLLRNSIYLALDELAKNTKDSVLVNKLASLGSTRFGQEISILTEKNPHSAIKYIKELKDWKQKLVGYKDNFVLEVRKKTLIRKAEKFATSKNHLSASDWSSFIKSITC